jgi:hypothetical protein
MSVPKHIVVLDDKDHALKQILYEFPSVPKSDLVFRHFDSLQALRTAGIGRAFMVFLDFFLSKDREYGTAALPELECEHLVCFSSRKQMSDHMKAMAESDHDGRIGRAYSVQKIKGTTENAELRQTLASILGPASSHGV